MSNKVDGSLITRLKSALAAVLLVAGATTVSVGLAGTPARAGAASEAVAWAVSKIGQDIYVEECLSFVHDAYSMGAGVEIGTGYGNPVGYWNTHTSGQQPGTTPPVGALVFWGGTTGFPDGHVAISEGGGSLISSSERT